MAAATKIANVAALGVASGPESVVLVASTNLDVTSNIDFAVQGDCEAVELTIVAGPAAVTGSPSVVFKLQYFDLASGTFIDVISSAAVVAAGSTFLSIGHNIGAVANHSAAFRPVRSQMRLVMTYTGTPVTDVLNGVTVTASAV